MRRQQAYGSSSNNYQLIYRREVRLLSRRMVAITYIVRFSWSGADIGFQAFGVVGFNTADGSAVVHSQTPA